MSADNALILKTIEKHVEKMELGRPLSYEEGGEDPNNTDQKDSKDGSRKSRNRQAFDLKDIIEGKREKKTVTRLDFQVAKPKERLKIENGSGDKLGDIARSNHQIGRMKALDLKPLHKILFDRPGAVSTMRKNMRLFNGFSFDVNSDLYNKKQKMMLRLTNAKLRTICKVLDLERGGTQSVLVERILTFLMAPKITGRLVITKKKKKSKKKISSVDSAGKTKAKHKSASRSPRKPKAESKSRAIVTDSSSEDEDQPGVTASFERSEAEKKSGRTAKKDEQTSGAETGDSDEEEEEDDDEEEEVPKPKAAMKGKGTLKKTTPVKKRPAKAAGPPKKKVRVESSDSEARSPSDTGDEVEKDSDSEADRGTRKKPAAKKARPAKPAAKTKKADSSSNRRKLTTDKDTVVNDSSDDDEPLIKMIKKPPSDEQLKETLTSILKDANLEEMTMKHICQKVYDTYPSYDLTGRKDFIKRTVKSLIS